MTTLLRPKFLKELPEEVLKEISRLQGVTIKSLAINLNPAMTTSIYLFGEDSGFSYNITGNTFINAPLGNCGILEVGNMHTISVYPPVLKKWWIKCLEAFARHNARSVIMSNDGANGHSYNIIKQHGEGWEFKDLCWNRNYDKTNKHKVSIFWKDVGLYEYPDEYGFGKAFSALPADYPRG